MIRTASLMFVLFSVLCSNTSALTDEEKSEIQKGLLKIGTECYKEMPITEQEINDIKNKKIDTDNLKCFVACGFKKVGVFNEEGKLTPTGVVESVKSILKEQGTLDNLVEFLQNCISVNSEPVDTCERGKLTFECLDKFADKYGYQMDFS